MPVFLPANRKCQERCDEADVRGLDDEDVERDDHVDVIEADLPRHVTDVATARERDRLTREVDPCRARMSKFEIKRRFPCTRRALKMAIPRASPDFFSFGECLGSSSNSSQIGNY